MGTKKKKLKVLSMKIENVLGLSEYAIEPGKISVIKGKNATGKTTLLESMKNVYQGGNLAKLARLDKDGNTGEPKVVIVMEEEEGRRYIVEKKGRGSAKVKAQVGDTAAFEDVVKPQRFLSGLFDDTMCNPIHFINIPGAKTPEAKNKQRVLMLLGALPLTLDRDGLWKALGIQRDSIAAIPEGFHPLQELTMIREAIFNERTGVNRDEDGKRKTVEQILRSIPAVLPPDHDEQITELENEIIEQEKSVSRRIERAENECESGCDEADREARRALEDEEKEHDEWVDLKRSQLKSSHDKRRAELEAELAKEEAALEAEIATEAKRSRSEMNISKNKCDERKRELQAAKTEEINACLEDQKKVTAKKQELTQLKEAAKQTIEFKTLRDQAERFEEEAEELKVQSEKLTEAIEALDAWRRGMVENLPIPGLEVDDKEIRVDGVPFDQLNTAKQMEIAVKIACLRAKEHPLPVVWVDGAEALDNENFAELIEYLNKEPVQAIIGRVENGDLKSEVVK